jgi:hypothetical protein
MTDIINLNNTLPLHPFSDELSATLVPDEQRQLLATALRQHTAVDNPRATYLRLDGPLLQDYSGGIWQFYTLSNGGALWPRKQMRIR